MCLAALTMQVRALARNWVFRGAFLAAFAAGLTGCGTGASSPGIFNGLGDDPMSMLIIYRTDNQPLTYAQYLAVQKLAQRMHIVLLGQLSSPFEAGLSGGVAYGAAGALGGASQGLFYTGALAGPAAGYTGIVYGLGGVITGVTTYSYGADYSQAQMVETAMRDAEKYDHTNAYYRLHVVAAFVRSRNGINSPSDSLRRQMPDFHGPLPGTPVANDNQQPAAAPIAAAQPADAPEVRQAGEAYRGAAAPTYTPLPPPRELPSPDDVVRLSGSTHR